MDIINNKYRVIKLLKKTDFSYTYLVSDLTNENILLKLNSVLVEKLSNKCKCDLINEFSDLIKIDTKNINTIYDYGVIKRIDNKKIDKIYVFFVSKFIYNDDLYKKLNLLTNDEIIECFIGLVKSINYLHLKGLSYREICYSNLSILYENNKPCFILKDLLNIKLEDYNLSYKESLEIFSPSISEYKHDVFCDIYSLGVLLFSLTTKTFNLKILKKNIHDLKMGNENYAYKNTCLYIKLSNIIIKMLGFESNRYSNLNEVIKDINKVLTKNYKSFRKEEVEKLNFNMNFIGRRKEINAILDNYSKFNESPNFKSFCIVYGESGVGKTTFLNNIKNMFILKGEKVYDNISIFKIENKSSNSFLVLLKKIILDAPKELLEKYEEELVKIIPEIGKNKEIKPSKSLNGNMERLKLVNRISSFLNDFTKGNPLIIILDNFHLVDKFMLEVINYITILSKNNIFFIFGFTNDKVILNKELINWSKKNEICNNTLNVSLKGLDLKETDEMIRGMLFVKDNPINLSDKIYKNSEGNPLFIEEIIKDLCFRKVIYVNETGSWVSSYTKGELPIPYNMEQALINQLKEISSEEIEVLRYISLFKESITISTLKKIIKNKKINLDNVMESLIYKDIICTSKIEDNVFIDMHNKFFKIIVYKRLKDSFKLNKHKAISQLLEQRYLDGDYGIIDELIYHLEKANDKRKVIEYSISNSLEMFSKNLNMTLYYCNKALDYYKNDEVDKDKIKIYLIIGDVYFDMKKLKESEEYYNNALKASLALKDRYYCVETLNKLNELYSLTENVDKLKSVLDSIGNIAEKCNDKKCKLQFYFKKAIYYSYIYKFEECKELCNAILKECDETCDSIKSDIYNLLAYVYMEFSDVTKAIKYLNMSIKYCKKYGNVRTLNKVFINLAVIYSDFLQDYDNAILYFKKAEIISESNKLFACKIKVKCNLAAMWLLNQNYKECIKELNNIRDSFTKEEYNEIFLYWGTINTSVNLRINKFYEAYKSYKEVNSEIKKYNNLKQESRAIIENYLSLVEFNIILGDIEQAQVYMRPLLKRSELEKSILLYNINIFKNYIDIFKDNNNLIEVLDNVDVILKQIKNINIKIQTIVMIANILLLKGKIKELKAFINYNYEYLEYEDVGLVLKTRILYVKSFLCDKEKEKIRILKSVLELSRGLELKEIYYKAAINLGDINIDKNNYSNATIYYFIACEAFKDLLYDLPCYYKNTYIKMHNLEKIYEKFILLKNLYMGKEKERVQIEEIFVGNGFNKHMDILKNKELVKSARNACSLFQENKIESICDILPLLEGDDYENIDVLNRYISHIALATKSFILINKNYKYEVISSVNNQSIDSIGKQIIHRVKNSRKSKIVSENYYGRICMPILLSKYDQINYLMDDRRKKLEPNKILLGYIYIETDKMIDYLVDDIIKACEQVSKILSIIIEKINLKENAFYDKLTGALTRKYLEVSLNEILEVSQTYNDVFSIIMIDFDYFKHINDTFGHQTGDKVLSEVSKIIRENIRRKDVFARYGGEELIIILPKVEKESAYKVAEQLRKKVEERDLLSSNMKVTISLGIVSFPQHGTTYNELMEKVDKALYIAKEKGRNSTIIWNDNLNNKIIDNNMLSSLGLKGFIQEEKYVFTMIDLLNLVKKEIEPEKKSMNFLRRVVELISADKGIVFIVENNNIMNYINYKKLDDHIKEVNFNKDLVNSTICNKNGFYSIDWDYIEEYDKVMNTPDWKSVISIPIIFSSNVIGVLYFSVSSRKKEFNYEDYNLCNLLSSIIIPIIIQISLNKNK